MNRISARTLDFFDRQVTQAIGEKYGLNEISAIKSFIQSETYQMLSDPELELYKLSPRIIFDLWENEKVTGDPRNSLYLRSDEVI